jgi:hypothetical protein
MVRVRFPGTGTKVELLSAAALKPSVPKYQVSAWYSDFVLLPRARTVANLLMAELKPVLCKLHF